MHERSLMNGLMKQLESLAREQGAIRITAIRLTLGAFSHMSPEHFREHFAECSRGSIAEGCRLDIQASTDTADPRAMDVALESVEVEVTEER